MELAWDYSGFITRDAGKTLTFWLFHQWWQLYQGIVW